jgi:hypothetical protein
MHCWIRCSLVFLPLAIYRHAQGLPLKSAAWSISSVPVLLPLAFQKQSVCDCEQSLRCEEIWCLDLHTARVRVMRHAQLHSRVTQSQSNLEPPSLKPAATVNDDNDCMCTSRSILSPNTCIYIYIYIYIHIYTHNTYIHTYIYIYYIYIYI